MSGHHQLLNELKHKGVKLWVEAGKLKFRAPEGVMTAALKAELRRLKPEILALLQGTTHAAIPRLPDAPDYPLSHAQRRLWVLSQIEKDTSAYNIPLHMVLDGDLHRDALKQAFHLLITRHEALRTTFPTRAGEPRQKVNPSDFFRFDFEDWCDAPADRIEKRAAAETAKPFDLAADPLLRATLIRLQPRRHALLLTVHHIICDGWSLSVMLRELTQAYAAALQQKEPDWAPLRIHYRDFAAWQEQQTAAGASQHADYWLKQLAAPLPVLDLPTDRPRPARQTFAGEKLFFTVPHAEALGKLAVRHGATRFMVLLALVKLVLYRTAGQQDLIVGTPVTGRGHADLEGQVGFYLNMLPLRSQIDPKQGFSAWLGQVRQTVLDGFAHEGYPFDKLIDELDIKADMSRSPLFDVMVQSQNAGDLEPALGDITITPLPNSAASSKYDLTFDFNLTPRENGFEACLTYNSDLYAPSTMARLRDHLLRLTEAVTADPNQALARCPMLTDEESAALMQGANPGETRIPAEFDLITRFLETARDTPNTAALRYERGDGSLATTNYRELASAVNHLAAELHYRGIGPGSKVAVLLERTPEMVIALLALLHRGATYIPLDPMFPKDRLTAMLADATPDWLITQTTLVASLPKLPAETLLLDETPLAGAPGKHQTFPAPVLCPEFPAYTIYTSGSTGRPKGVVVPRRALNNFLFSMQQQPGMDRHDVLVAVTTISFDIAALELYLPLMTGATLVLAPAAVAADGPRLVSLLDRVAATHMQATPAGWRLLLESGWHGRDAMTLLSGGEALPGELAAKLLAKGKVLWNLYGPTETTIWSARTPITPDLTHTQAMPLGRPLANTQLYVLDGEGCPVPVGVVGELVIGGAGLAHGYHKRPDLTAAAFVPDPFSDTPGARMYRTGDLVARRGDGLIDFLGRRDQQVKVRGFRIELGDIEQHLQQHPRVLQAVVCAPRDKDQNHVLVAYLRVSGTALDSAAPRSFLQPSLPGYMIPSHFVCLDEFPLTANGKVDRKTLNNRPLDVAEQSRERIPPRDDLERELRDIWCNVLGVASLSIDDDFFGLGGHSLKGTRLVFQVQHAFDVTLSLFELFNHPVFADFADLIRRQQEPDPALIADFMDTIAPLTAEELELLND
ncbi:non-ribosomal peptide synthetase [Acanthopleuribacter pedis]|uniref:Amino acid adenylation domain-containing protein n=1 Tax=Acanthopleuribacter pedis TaxID=442870 RepID=A0A8J7Q7B5_9BACT|nr:non-ribosomal peptide synthetase [Acanthopleuribacter pedis]MBO1317347.1 amino acid adenylation domain-containing protein [Acanthopleuribacter pedis]MBO1318654.1 amino acid adenylation domain-containing protein [Acanthopleuribacter pedis]